MRQLVYLHLIALLCIIPPLANAISTAADITVGYNVPVNCSLVNLPTNINLNILATETGLYTTNFSIECNSSNSIGLTMSSSNQSSGGARLLSATGNYLNYTVSINSLVYTMGQTNQVIPNVSNVLKLDIAKPTYAGQYQDTLVFTISY